MEKTEWVSLGELRGSWIDCSITSYCTYTLMQSEMLYLFVSSASLAKHTQRESFSALKLHAFDYMISHVMFFSEELTILLKDENGWRILAVYHLVFSSESGWQLFRSCLVAHSESIEIVLLIWLADWTFFNWKTTNP